MRSSASTYKLQAAISEDRHWPITLMGVFSTVLLSAGVLRHYYDVYIHRTVRGISFIFVGIDAAGDVFSLVSICRYIDNSMSPQKELRRRGSNSKVFQASLDILGIVIYATEFLLWCGIFACGGYFNFAPWLRQMMSQRSTPRPQTPENSGPQPLALEGGASRDVSLHSVASSTSVFRTPSSVHSYVMASELSDLERSGRRL